MVVFRKAFAHRLVAESSCQELVNSLVTLEVLTSILLISSDEVKFIYSTVRVNSICVGLCNKRGYRYFFPFINERFHEYIDNSHLFF
jgi:hypothetical protein